jgi:hypothetical protein
MVSSSGLRRHPRAIGASKLNLKVVLGSDGYIATAAGGTEGLLICANSYDTTISRRRFNNEAKHVCRDVRGGARHALTSRLIELVERLLVAGVETRSPRDTEPHASQAAKSDDWSVNHRLSNGGTEIGECERECENEYYWSLTARRTFRLFRAKPNLVR